MLLPAHSGKLLVLPGWEGPGGLVSSLGGFQASQEGGFGRILPDGVVFPVASAVASIRRGKLRGFGPVVRRLEVERYWEVATGPESRRWACPLEKK